MDESKEIKVGEGKENNETVTYFGSRVKEGDKQLFIDLCKKMGVTQHELFSRVLDTFVKMESIEEVASDNKGHAEELRGHLDRILSIFMELSTSSENTKNNLKELHKQEIGLKNNRIRELEERIERLKAEKKLVEESFKKQQEKEMSLLKEIAGLRKEADHNLEAVKDKDIIIKDREENISKLKIELAEYSAYKEDYQKLSEENQGLKNTITKLEKEIAGKDIEIKGYEKREKMLSEQVKDLTQDKKEKTAEMLKLREESAREIDALRKEIRELNNKLLERVENTQKVEREYQDRIINLTQKIRELEATINSKNQKKSKAE